MQLIIKRDKQNLEYIDIKSYSIKCKEKEYIVCANYENGYEIVASRKTIKEAENVISEIYKEHRQNNIEHFKNFIAMKQF